MYAKDTKEIKETEKEKKKRNKNIKRGPGEPFGPVWRSSPQPRKDTKTVSLIFSLTSLTCGAHSSGHISIFFLGPNFTPATVSPL
jgi:hypothetical protein